MHHFAIIDLLKGAVIHLVILFSFLSIVAGDIPLIYTPVKIIMWFWLFRYLGLLGYFSICHCSLYIGICFNRWICYCCILRVPRILSISILVNNIVTHK